MNNRIIENTVLQINGGEKYPGALYPRELYIDKFGRLYAGTPDSTSESAGSYVNVQFVPTFGEEAPEVHYQGKEVCTGQLYFQMFDANTDTVQSEE